MSLSKVCPQCGAVYGAESRFCSVDGATLVLEQPADDLVGTIVADRYHILERIGAGGMGEVFLAEHVRMKRKSALKVMREALTSDPVAVSRFHREAENASQINHPNVASVYDFGETPNGLVYIAMEYIPGEPLSDVLDEEGALNPARVADIIAQAADALSAAHGLGILHRDLKPDNIMLTSTRWGTDLVKLVDFGISRAMASATQQFTSTGMIVGTPDYMSPEQLTGDALDSRSDQYALALIAYFALTGTFPYPAGASKDALLTRLTTAPRKLADVKPDVAWPEALQATFDRALALDVNERFAEVHEFGRELDAAIAQMPATDTMEHYREALRQRFTTPRSAPLVTPPRPQPSLQMTPVTPMPSVAATADVIAPVDPPVDSTEITAPALGKPPRARRSVARRLTAVGATLALVGFVVWQYAAARPSTSATAPVDSPPAPSPTAPATQSASAAGALVPALPLDSVATVARASVFPLYGDGQQGSAFLVDLAGIVLTSAEFVRRGAEPRIQLDTGRHVAARVMSVDSTRGVAALRIPIQYCRQCVALELAADSASRVSVGDSLVLPTAVTRGNSAVDARGAVTQTDGSGIQTSLRLDNRAAAGAPVLSTRSSVVGLALRRRNGQANVVPAAALAKLRSDALRRRSEVLPNDTLIPMWPATPVQRSVLNAAKARADADLVPYKAIQGDFELLVMTPQVMVWRADQIRSKIEAAQIMAIGEADPRRVVDAIQSWREWNVYTGERRAVVVLHATPELAGYDRLRRGAVIDLKHGDVGDLRLLRGGDTLVRPIEAARIPAVANPEAYRSANQRVYSAGVAVYHPREFARRLGRFPVLVVELIDAQTRRSTRVTLSQAALEAIERDLRPFQR